MKLFALAAVPYLSKYLVVEYIYIRPPSTPCQSSGRALSAQLRIRGQWNAGVATKLIYYYYFKTMYYSILVLL